jgi:hypothetical protein
MQRVANFLVYGLFVLANPLGVWKWEEGNSKKMF